MSSPAVRLPAEEPVTLRVLDPRVGHALRFMEENLHRVLSVADIAEAAGISPSRFARPFSCGGWDYPGADASEDAHVPRGGVAVPHPVVRK